MGKRKISLLSNITVDMVAARLKKNFEVYTPSGYDSWVSEVLNIKSDLYTFKADMVFILLDGTESRSWKDIHEASDRIELWRRTIKILLQNISDVPVFVSTLDIRANPIVSMSETAFDINVEHNWYDFLNDLISNRKNVFINDLKLMITDIGRKTFYDDKMWYFGSMPYSREGITKISDEITRLIERYFNKSKKIIVLDLDNTLWGGVIGEDGVGGIVLSDHNEGQRYYDFQRQLLEMKNRGVLLAINSKNNIEDVEKVFKEHPYMILKWDDFVSRKINWNNKASNIREMQAELNLTEVSFVFIDDNPVEREIVKGECSEVTVPDFPTDTTKLLDFGVSIYKNYFQQPRVLQEDMHKTEMYRAEEKRKSDWDSSLGLEEYIGKLEMEADIHKMLPSEVQRVAQLCGKTNQFNVTTKRYTENDIINMSSESGIEIFTVHTKDKYGEAGLVSVIILKLSKVQAVVDTFLMSCRVMGRKLENVIMDEIEDYCTLKGINIMEAQYIATAKNTPVKNLYETLGYSVVADGSEIKKYTKNIQGKKNKKYSLYKKVFFKAE